MLLPVNAAANSSTGFQEPRPVQAGPVAANLRPQGAPPQAANGLEQNAAIAGRLNILILSSQERMSESLAMLVNLLGNRLGIERREGESGSGYAARLVQALGELSPQARQSVQRQLTQMFAGLQLRTLMEAFRNPVGPEAATLAIYLEHYRTKDKDLATRTVVTSYRQNSGEARAGAIPLTAQTSAGRLSSSAAPVHPARGLPSAQQTSTLVGEANRGEIVLVDGEAPDDPMASVAKGRLFGMQDEQSRKTLKLAAARAMQAAMFHGAMSTARGSVAEPALVETGKGTDDAAPPQEQRARQLGKESEAPAISGRMSAEKSFEVPATSARATPAAVIDTADDPVPSKNASSLEPAGPMIRISPEKDGKDQPEPTTKAQTLFALKRWTEESSSQAETLLPLSRTAQEVEPEPARLLRSAAAGDAEAAQASQNAGLTGDGPEAAAKQSVPATERHIDEALDQPEGAAVHAEAADDARSARGSLPHDLPDVETALQRQPAIGRDGVPLPLVSYLFAEDEMEEQKGLKHRFRDDRDGEASDGDADGLADERGEDEREGEEQPESIGQPHMNESERADQIEAGGEDETPNDLYWRMAGWS